MPSFEPLVNEYRGEILDLVHMGYICIVDENSRVIWHAGDPDETVFYRSASKPIQALPVIARGLDKKYALTDEETAIFAGSHQGDSFHVAALESIFEKAGFTEDMLCMAPAMPQVPCAPGTAPRKFYHNCSGKHAGAMLLQRELGGEARDYWREDSPAQREIRRAVAALSEFPEENVGVGLDGCGVPVFAVGMKNIAIAFKNLACPDMIADEALLRAAREFVPRMHSYPLMIKGRNTLCSMLNADPQLVAKGGANGAYGLGIKSLGIGISIKFADGTNSMWPMVIAAALRYVGYENQSTLSMLDRLCPETIVNDNGDSAGRRRLAFDFQKGR